MLVGPGDVIGLRVELIAILLPLGSHRGQLNEACSPLRFLASAIRAWIFGELFKNHDLSS